MRVPRWMRSAIALPMPIALVACLSVAPPARADFAHVVVPGETLTSVAAQDGLSEQALAAANGLSTDAELIAGSVLEIPPRSGADDDAQAPPTADATSGAQAPGAAGGSYLVEPGDTLTAIAARAGTSVAALAALNGLDPAGVLEAGLTLRLPAGAVSGGGSAQAATGGGSAQAATGGGSAQAATGGGSAQAATGSGPPYPTPTFVTAGQIAAIADGDGVPAPLAEAIAWQESGFDNDEVSSAGAVGVMQILPATWSWITSNLAGGSLLNSASATGNVTAGVLLLRSLLAATGSQPLAIAAFLQGLASVQRIGILPAARQYVADVLALEQRFAGS
jgi:LysM repeat protein